MTDATGVYDKRSDTELAARENLPNPYTLSVDESNNTGSFASDPFGGQRSWYASDVGNGSMSKLQDSMSHESELPRASTDPALLAKFGGMNLQENAGLVDGNPTSHDFGRSTTPLPNRGPQLAYRFSSDRLNNSDNQFDTRSVHSGDSFGDQYSVFDGSESHANPAHQPPSMYPAPQTLYPQSAPWLPGQPNVPLKPPLGASRTPDYDYLYASGSNGFGNTPPPMPGPSNLTSFPPVRRADYAPSIASTVNQGGHSMGTYAGGNPYHLSSYQGILPSNASIMSSGAQTVSSESSGASTIHPDDREFEARPRPFNSPAGFSRATKTKAVDLTAPPYTKEYIDQYRQRMKVDPDPEAHFAYAKYLIDAAKKIGADAKDQRSVKKYRDLLIAESLKVIRRLATQGDGYEEAQFFLANCFGTGILGLQVDHERAYHLYLQAAKQNHAAASYRVAVCNEIGAGTKKELPRAAAFYRKAASLGDTAAMYKLGLVLLHGQLGEMKNPREAINWLKRAAEQADEENPHALHELALLHESNSGIVPHDPALAKQLLTQAAHLGYNQSQFKLGQCYEYGTLTCPVDPRRSIAWYTKAAEKGDSEAELALSGWYLTGSEGVLKQSDSEAYLWARRAGNKGLSKAEYAVGYYAEVGIGIKQDIEFAKRWYMRAAAQGNKRAMNRLTEMKRMGTKRNPNSARPTRQQAKDECIIS